MTALLIVVCVIAWWSIGFASYAYWWTQDHDLGIDDAVFGIFVGAAGPLAFLMGWGIHGKHHRVLLKRRAS